MRINQIGCWLLAVVVLMGCRAWSAAPAATAMPAHPTPTPTQNITILHVTIHDSYFGEHNSNASDPPIWEVPAGSVVLLNIENMGHLQHNWAIVKPGVTPPAPYDGGQDDEIILYGAGMVYSNNKTTVTFTAPSEPGEYLVMCTVENHYPLMQGRLIVK